MPSPSPELFEGFQTRAVETSGATLHVRLGGDGPPLLLLHGYPQTHAMWHKVAPALAERFTVVMPDLRGYGRSSKPEGGAGHANYTKRAMALDAVELMRSLGHARFSLVGHDRGGRVAFRLLRDHPGAVHKLALLDIAPTDQMYAATDRAFATAYYHWFFLIQPHPLPERLIAADPAWYLQQTLQSWKRTPSVFDPQALDDYLRAFTDPATVHAMCEDYRASAGVDLEHDAADTAVHPHPLLVLWGRDGIVGRMFEPLAAWRQHFADVQGHAVPGGHFLAEEAPAETLEALLAFL